MRTLIKVGVSLLLLAFALIGVSYTMLRAQGLSNPGSAAGRAVRSEARTIGKNIHTIEVSGPIDLTVRQGLAPSLLVRGEQRLLANVETSERGATLHIGPKGMLLHHRQPLQVELVLPALQQLDMHGSGDSTVNGFSGERFELRVHGSGNVTFNGRFKHVLAGMNGSGDLNLNGGNSGSVTVNLAGSGAITTSGSCNLLRAELSGSGDLDAEHLAADRVEVSLQGSGAAVVFARDAADLTLRGSGNIKVYGNPPQRRSSSNGSGDIEWE
ncbi:hypothetical protein ACFDR9_000170 [Janthinobacterium sp. CG_23.3]|uniref:head GIN domain-containing protein n=1 Tax=unclassified Janthinobacterium TaxID=2610881 RepID=UPI00034BFF5C|nr:MULTISPECIES: head GIN domain-containing protein [unclassified Janthinobacterium]MEC5160750.1 hypothetical protein [Janthinobacterium sp. CG_S6]